MSSPWSITNALASHRPGEWLNDALCAQVSHVEFFPGKSESAMPAKKICRMCEVREECGEYALTSPVFLLGVWGGMSENERRKIRRREGVQSVPVSVFTNPHGTAAGAAGHRRLGEKPCEPCLQAEKLARNGRDTRSWYTA